MRRRMRQESRFRSGFTLIELLVVIAIIGVLVALIMPAVQAARESANKAKCQNNLKQLALAAQEYHDAFTSFPSGWLCQTPGTDQNGNPTGDPSCAYANTPYQQYMWNGLIGLFLKLEQTNLYNEMNLNLANTAPDNTTSVRRTIDAFVCPSNRRPPQQNPLSVSTQFGTTVSARFGPLDYRGNMAAGFMTNTGGCSPDTTQATLTSPLFLGGTPTPVCLVYSNGVAFQNSQINLADVTDGASNTILYGESLDSSSNPTAFWPWAMASSIRTNFGIEQTASATASDRTINRPITINGTNYWVYWASKHPNMVNFARCDGSVTSVSAQINKLVLNKLMTRNGGESISSDEIK
jgi:prepilin-type N-terminal cleavage/methylation domain-containing protein/prepilin-type processing-associated H-X9-DG protein